MAESEVGEYSPKEMFQEFQELKNARTIYEPAWRELNFLTSPRRNRWQTKKDQKTPEFYDRFCESGVLALRGMVDGVLGAVFNPAHQWFRSKQQDEFLAMGDIRSVMRITASPMINNQLSAIDELIANELRNGSFYTAAREFLMDLYGTGNGLTMFWNNSITGAPVYKTEHMKNVWFSENDNKEIDRVFRKVVLNHRDVMNVFNRLDDFIPDQLKNILKNNAGAISMSQQQYGTLDSAGTGQITFYHCITYDYDDKQWKSLYAWEGDQEHFIREGYFDYKPFAAARCYTNSDEVYGYAPGHDVLGALLTSNQMAKTLLKAGQLSVDPVLTMDASFRDGLDLTPGAVNYTTNTEAMARKLYEVTQYPIAKDQADRIDQMISLAHFADFFRNLSDMKQRMTAVQVMALQGEKAPLLSGLTNSLEVDYLIPILRGTYEIAKAEKRIPADLIASFGKKESLDSLYSKSSVRFTGMLPQLAANFQQYGDLQKFLTVANAAVSTFQDTTVLDYVNKPALSKIINEASNMPANLLLSDDDVNKMRTARAKQQVAQAQQETMQNAVKGMRDTGQSPSPGSPGSNAMEYLSQGGLQ